MKTVDRLSIEKDKEGFLIWKETDRKDIRNGILSVEAACLVLAVKINELVDVVNSMETPHCHDCPGLRKVLEERAKVSL